MSGTHSKLEPKNEMNALQLAPRSNPEPPRFKIALEICGLAFAQIAIKVVTPEPETEVVPYVEEQEVIFKTEDESAREVSALTEPQSASQLTIIYKSIEGSDAVSSPHPHEGDSIPPGAATSGDSIDPMIASGSSNTTQSPPPAPNADQENYAASEKDSTRASVVSGSTNLSQYPGVYKCVML